MSKIKWLLVLFVVTSFILGIWRLGEVPPGMSHDELEYVNNGYSIFKTGRDLYGDFLPISIGGVGYVATPAYLAGLPTVIFGLHEWSVRLMPAIFGALEVLLVFGISDILFKSKKVAISSAFVFTFSTWSLKMSRVMFDPPVAFFFFLVGIYLFLKARDVRLTLASVVTILVGTLSYYGTLFVTPFLFLVLIVYRWKFLVGLKKQLIVPVLIIISLFGLVLFNMLSDSSRNTRSLGRTSELIIFDKTDIVDNVIFDRSQSTSSEIANRLFVNKATYVWKKFFFNYLEAFSPRMIFVEGDPTSILGLWGRGELSVLDFPLILLGIYFLFKKSKKEALLALSFVLIAPITSGLSGTAYSTRAFLMWPFLIIFAGGGLAYLWNLGYERRKKLGKVVRLLMFTFFTLYCYFVLVKLHQYFFRYPTYAKEIWFDSEKQLAFYLMEHAEEKIDIYSLEAREMFMEYFFFSKMDPRLAQSALSNDRRADINVGNLRFVTGCVNPETDPIEIKTIVHTRCVPLYVGAAKEVIKTRDGGDMIKWAIFTADQ